MPVHPVCRVYNKHADKKLLCRKCEEEQVAGSKKPAYVRYAAESMDGFPSFPLASFR